MGYLLAPVLANTFMGFHESKWLNEYNLKKTNLHLRYVDDILAAFDNEKDSLNFWNFLNNRHPNINFTIEKQIHYFITFLDAFISGIKIIKILHYLFIYLIIFIQVQSISYKNCSSYKVLFKSKNSNDKYKI